MKTLSKDRLRGFHRKFYHKQTMHNLRFSQGRINFSMIIQSISRL